MSDNVKQVRVVRMPHAADLPLPKRMTQGASGADVVAAVTEDMIIPPQGRTLVPTGLCFEIPQGFEVQVRSRSGLAAKNGVFVLNSPGTIDSDYRGEVKVILANSGPDPFTVRRGDRIAQLVVAAVAADVDFAENESLSSTSRGSGGFGHTGV